MTSQHQMITGLINAKGALVRRQMIGGTGRRTGKGLAKGIEIFQCLSSSIIAG
jgi:hypothetical protein